MYLLQRVLNYCKVIVGVLSVHNSLKLVIKDTKLMSENLLGGGSKPWSKISLLIWKKFESSASYYENIFQINFFFFLLIRKLDFSI